MCSLQLTAKNEYIVTKYPACPTGDLEVELLITSEYFEKIFTEKTSFYMLILHAVIKLKGYPNLTFFQSPDLFFAYSERTPLQ